MNDNFEDWEKKYWQRRAQQQASQPGPNGRNPEDLPHYEPVHIAQQNAKRQQPPTDDWRDVDPITSMYMNQAAMNARGMGPQSHVVQLREGVTYYKKVEAENFGNTMTMVRTIGPMAGVAGREFELKQECNCYLIDDLQVVDLGNVDQNKLLKLVEVRAPFIGSVLVEKDAVLMPSTNNKQLLKG